MRLNIKNFAKIKDADIIIDGITVIAGENNTGKSTVGKVLFSLFNSLQDIDNKILDDRAAAIRNSCIIPIFKMADVKKADFDDYAWVTEIGFYRNIIDELKETSDKAVSVTRETIDKAVEKVVKKAIGKGVNLSMVDFDKLANLDELLQNICESVATVWNVPEDAIMSEIISRYFAKVFFTQINTLSDEKKESVLTLEIKGKYQKIYFRNNDCVKYEQEIRINHKAIYIDNPLIIDHLSNKKGLNLMESTLTDLLDKDKDDIFSGVVEKMLAEEKLANIYKMLQTVVDGEIIVDQNEKFYLKSGKFKEPIILQNLSTGLKSFVILKMLLENGSLKEKDVVILDEPEIHLHPQWQIVYAELIVLLQKTFDLSIVVTTHSPYFVDALNLFSCKYETDKKVNYYLSSNVDNMVKMEHVSDHIESIYRKMVSPVQTLDTLRYELNNK